MKTPMVNGKQFGEFYGDKTAMNASFITPDGPVWMWRRGCRVRYFNTEGVQVGPEHSNVYPAMLAAFAAGWQDPNISRFANLMCKREVLVTSRVRPLLLLGAR